MSPPTHYNLKPKLISNFFDVLCVTVSPLMDNTIDVCGFSAEISNYSVKGVSLDSKKIGGCAYTNYTKNGMEVKKSFNVWLSDLQSGKQQCGEEGKCNKLLF